MKLHGTVCMRNDRRVVYFNFYRESQSSSNSYEPRVSACSLVVLRYSFHLLTITPL